MKTNQFTAINSPDMDIELAIRPIIGNVTKDRFKTLYRIARNHSGRSRCSHDYDCCGCVCATYVDIVRYNGVLSVRFEQHRNY